MSVQQNKIHNKNLEEKYLLIDKDVLPDVYIGVIKAKQLLAQGKASSATKAVEMAGISRSAFYKYKDYVFTYSKSGSGKILTLHAVLRDEPGILSTVLSAFAKVDANILTVNQNIPTENKASISISARIDNMRCNADSFISSIASIDGVVQVDGVASGQLD